MKLYRLFGLVVLLPLLKAQICNTNADCVNNTTCINLGNISGCGPNQSSFSNEELQALRDKLTNPATQTNQAAPNPQNEQRNATTGAGARCSMDGPNTCGSGLVCLEGRCIAPVAPTISPTRSPGPKSDVSNTPRNFDDINSTDQNSKNGTLLNATQLTELFKMLTDANRTSNNSNTTSNANDTDDDNSTNSTTKNNTNVPKVPKLSGAMDNVWLPMTNLVSTIMIGFMVSL